MTRGLTRASVLAIKEETTEGTLIQPGAATDFLAIQPTPEMTENKEFLTNDEIRNSIDEAKGIPGISAPSFSFSHYLRHSGVEGTAPNFAPLLKALFGSQSSQSTQRTTTSGSSVSVVKLGAGGSDYARGKALLIKDPTNGYSIRPVHSVSSNDLTLGFDLANAPATGVSCGKFVNFSPTSSGHPSLSVHMYNGNGHSIESCAGMKVTEFSFDASAGELLNASYSMVGTKYFFNPIVIASTDRYLDFNDGSVRAAAITAQTYTTPHEVASALQTAMNAAGSSDTFTVTYSNTTGKFTISTSGATLSLLWNTGTNAANTIGDKIGFSTAADDTSATTYTSDNAQSWAPPYTPSYDSLDPTAVVNNEVLIGDSTSTTAICADNISFSFTNENTQIKCINAETGIDANFFGKRTIEITVQSIIEQFDADFINRLKNVSDTRFLFNFGVKSGGNWVAGKCGSVYGASCTITEFKTIDLNGVVGAEIKLKAYADTSGNGALYLNFL